MPGLIGVIPRVPGPDLAPVFERLLAPMRRGGRLAVETHEDPQGRFALGRTHLGFLQPAPQLAEKGSAGPLVLVHGTIDNEPELRAWLEKEGRSAPGSSATALVSAVYRAIGSGFAARLRGAFCAAVLDGEGRKLVLASDLVGSYPLYWLAAKERFVFASELRSVVREPSLARALDARAAADYLVFGFPLGERTLAEGVKLLPAASTLTYDLDSGAVAVEPYRRIQDLFIQRGGTREERYGEVGEAFDRAVARAFGGGHRFALSLSGGLDTRAILGAMNGAASSISTYTLGVKGCADEVIADKLARLAGTRHRFFELDDRYLGDFLPNLTTMVSLTDGMYLTHGLTEMLALRRLEEMDFEVLLRGHGGELAKASLAWPFHTDERIHAMTSQEELIPYVAPRIGYVSRGVSLRELFADAWLERAGGDGGPERSLRERLEPAARLAPAEALGYLYLTEHHRRFTVASLELFRNQVEVRMPFVDEEVLAALFGMPVRWRDGADIHLALLRRRRPAFARVRNSNTGAPANAGPLVRALLDKVSAVFKRLNVYGYRHYHSLAAWMHRTLVESVEAVLLDRATLARGIFREATLRRLVEETRLRKADHAHLLQVLLILELWQRENVG